KRASHRQWMRREVEAIPNLYLRQGEVITILTEGGRVIGVELMDGRLRGADAVVITTGAFLNGLIHSGPRRFSAGRSGEPPSIKLAENLREMGFRIARLKTGTPPRLDGRSIDYKAFEEQPGDEIPTPFSFTTRAITQRQISCHIGYTTHRLHQTMRDNSGRSPLYSGQFVGVAPRYSPSIKEKVVNFPEKDPHHPSRDPGGYHPNKVYLNAFSTSPPADLQRELVN